MPNQQPRNNIIDELVVKMVADASDLVPQVRTALDNVKKVSRETSVVSGQSVSDVTGKITGLTSIVQKFGGAGKLAMGAVTGAASTLASSLGGVMAAFGSIQEAWRNLSEAAQEKIAEIGLERRFALLAGSISQSTEDMMVAMNDAAEGVMTKTEMLQNGVYALNAGLKLTPELLRELTDASIELSNALMSDPSDTFKELVNAIAHADADKLASLGVSMGDIYANLDRIAQVDYEKPSAMLASYERDGAFAKAAIEAVSDAVDGMDESLQKFATAPDEYAVGMEKIKESSNDAKFVIHNFASKTWVELRNAFADTDMFQRNVELASTWKDKIIAIVADVFSFLVSYSENVSRRFDAMWGVVTKQTSLAELKATFDDTTFNKTIEDAKARAAELKKAMHSAYDDLPKLGAAGELTGADKPENDIAQASNAYRTVGLRYAKSLQRYMQTLNQREAKLGTDHQIRMEKILRDGLAARENAQAKYTQSISDLAAEVAKKRESILASSLKRQETLTKNYQTTSKRAEEDYQKAMRRLKEKYLFDLEDAVKERDARAIVDLKRKYDLDKKHGSEDFADSSSRRRQDYERSLTELRAATDDQLAALDAYQQEKAAALAQRRDDEIAAINADIIEKSRIENEAYEQRKAELDQQLRDRLTTIAQGMADENDITASGAQTILETLVKTFGLDGDIDKLMDAFIERRKNDMAVAMSLQNAFSFGSSGGQSGGLSGSNPFARLNNLMSLLRNSKIPGMATGGAFLAESPTLIAVGEREPELITAAPIRSLPGLTAANQTSGGGVRRVSIDFSGSAPPGIMPQSRDEIARVVLAAIRDTGVMASGG